LARLAAVLHAWSGIEVPIPAGGFYLWFEVGDAWQFTERLVRASGALLSPGEFYGADGERFVRAAVVQPDECIDRIAERLGVKA
jgi:aminotransferase